MKNDFGASVDMGKEREKRGREEGIRNGPLEGVRCRVFHSFFSFFPFLFFVGKCFFFFFFLVFLQYVSLLALVPEKYS